MGISIVANKLAAFFEFAELEVPFPEGASAVASGSSSSFAAADSLEGVGAGAVGMPVHWLIGGALTLQTPGSSMALVWLTAMPKDVAVPSRTMQRQRGSVWTTPASTEQQEIPGSGALPEMKSMHGESVIITLEQPLPCAAALEKASTITAIRLVITETVPIVRAAIIKLHEATSKALDGLV